MSNETQQVQVTVEQIQGYLNDGKTRRDIANILGISYTDVKEMFQHPELKGKKTKTKKVPGFVFVDDNSFGQSSSATNSGPGSEEEE